MRLDRLAERGGLALLQLLHLVEALDEDQVGDLLDDLERIGQASRPEVVPDAVDLVAQFSRQHQSPQRDGFWLDVADGSTLAGNRLYRCNSAIRLEVSQRLPPIFCTWA
jgi:hypothetical protein